jgi:hypothetical protein
MRKTLLPRHRTLTLRPFRGCWVIGMVRETHLLNQGIDFQFKYTNEIAYNVTGGIRSEATYADQSFCAAEHKFSEP